MTRLHIIVEDSKGEVTIVSRVGGEVTLDFASPEDSLRSPLPGDALLRPGRGLVTVTQTGVSAKAPADLVNWACRSSRLRRFCEILEPELGTEMASEVAELLETNGVKPPERSTS